MSNGVLETPAFERVSAKRAWEAVDRLAVVSESIAIAWSPTTGRDDMSSRLVRTPRRRARDVGVPDAIPQALADILAASRALRRLEPSLSNWPAPPPETMHTASSVYLLIGLIWASTTLLVGGAIGAFAFMVW